MATDNNDNQGIIKRLDIIIALLLRFRSNGSEVTATEKIAELANLGLSRSEIGRIMGKPANYISAVLGTKKGKKR